MNMEEDERKPLLENEGNAGIPSNGSLQPKHSLFYKLAVGLALFTSGINIVSIFMSSIIYYM